MLEEIVPLDPVHFFAFQFDCYQTKDKNLEKRHHLPDLSQFYEDRPFAGVSIGWNPKGIYLQVDVSGKFDQPDFPKIAEADSIELFFDTRDVKTTGYVTRFCHHFFFLPAPLHPDGETIEAGEITRMRADDAHPLCEASQLMVNTIASKKNTVVHIFIPSECLNGYDPLQFDRLGFTYRINRTGDRHQLFSASDADFPIENQPSLWASLKLIK